MDARVVTLDDLGTVTVSGPLSIDDGGGSLTVDLQPSTVGTSSNVAASVTSVTLATANATRKGLTVFNDGGSSLYVKLGASASLTSFTVQILPKGYYETPYNYVGIVDAVWAAASGFARVTELT